MLTVMITAYGYYMLPMCHVVFQILVFISSLSTAQNPTGRDIYSPPPFTDDETQTQKYYVIIWLSSCKKWQFYHSKPLGYSKGTWVAQSKPVG